MKTDFYTRFMLTVIAVCLSIIVLRDIPIFPKAQASDKNTFTPYGTNGVIDVNIKSIDTSDELDVNISGVNTSDELDVNISGVETSDELDVNIDEIGGGYVSNGGPLSVKIK